MKTNLRFVVRNNRLVDTLNLTDDLGSWDKRAGNDWRLLRERVLYERLHKLSKKLFRNESFYICYQIFQIVCTSQLNTFDLEISVKHRFIGGRSALKRKEGIGPFASLQLFIDDFECLLRDLYGDIESGAMERVLFAVSITVVQQSRHIAPELYKEHVDAEICDWGDGINLPKGCSPSVSDVRAGMWAERALMRRARDVLAKPSAFSEYTVEFAKKVNEWAGLQIETE
jgi:hypothetical protein